MSLNPDSFTPDPEFLKKLITTKMPFGKFKGVPIYNLPVSYLEWFNRTGFPKGSLGMMLATMYEIKLNGLEDLLDPIKKGITM